MSNTKFTPGEWTISGDEKYTNVRNIFAYNNDSSVGVGVAEVFGRDFESNAHLIAAAPDLYDALEAMLENNAEGNFAEVLAYDLQLKEQARAALAKARGEPDYSTEPTKTAPKQKAAA